MISSEVNPFCCPAKPISTGELLQLESPVDVYAGGKPFPMSFACGN